MGAATSALPILGSIIGNNQASSDRGTAGNLVSQGVSAINGVQTPTDLTNPIYYQQYKSAGNLTPAQEQTINAAPSQAAQVTANPNLVNAQMQALNTLKGLSQSGMSAQDKATYNQMQQTANAQAQGQKAAALQNFAQRGMAGSGASLMAQLNAGQNAANQANSGGLQVAGQASQNALNALGQYGNQAGSMNTQQYGQQQQAAQAADALNRFNTQNQQSQQARNVAGQNSAQQYNLQNQQQIGNANTGQANAEMLRQVNAQQQEYQDAMQKAGALSGASFTGANAYNNMGNQVANQYANIGAGLGNMAKSALGGGGGGSNPPAYDPSSDPYNSLAHGGEAQEEPHYDNGGYVGGAYGDPAADPNNPFNQQQTTPPMPAVQPQQPAAPPTAPASPMSSSNSGGLSQLLSALTKPATPSAPASPSAPQSTPNPYLQSGSLLSPSLTEGPKSKSDNKSSGGMGSLTALAPLMSDGGKVRDYRRGGRVPGQGKVPGDDYANDTVDAKLSPKEIVIPRSITMNPNAPELSKHYVDGILNEKKGK